MIRCHARALTLLVSRIGFFFGSRAELEAEVLGVPDLTEARALVHRFAIIVRKGDYASLPGWLTAATNSELASFAKGLQADEVAVTAALREPWSNGQTEGQINKLKMLKRQMYGRANLDLLRARLVVTA